ncbi:hypothetical protein C2G38_2203794 [Gigaspora rosea]|uniref:Nudix hydrolase domain-containing protein n=1 Tax=Gigaspora rosea TaxID=44941 RepID=A0A397UP50_9GLOM|nr:hypothetical protein C2G38_2203794 [Gigaspora rosea]
MKECDNVQDVDNTNLSLNIKDSPKPMKWLSIIIVHIVEKLPIKKQTISTSLYIQKRFRKRDTNNVITKNTSRETLFRNDARNWRKRDVYTDNCGNETLETEEDAAMRETLKESGIILDEEKLQKIWKPLAMKPDKSSDWTWHTFQEVIFMNLLPMLQKNQDFIFQEIGKYFNYCKIESLGEQEESTISPMTETEFSCFKKKTEKLTTKEIITIEKYKKGVTFEINRLRGRLTKINK